MNEYLFFDLDGTLTDSQEGLIKSLQFAFEYFNIHQTPEQLRKYLGPSLKDTFMGDFGFSEENNEIAIKKFREYFEKTGIFENKVFPEIPELLEKLKKAGKRLVVATSKPEAFAVRICEHFGIAEYFDFICGATLEETRTAKAEVISYALTKCGFTDNAQDEVLMIGDRFNDVQGAHKNNLKCVYVLYGYGNLEEAEQNKADFIVESVKDLQKLLLSD